MSGQLNNAVKEARSREAIAIAEEMSRAYRAAMIGSVQPVLFEEPSGEYFTGHTPNYIKVYTSGTLLHNQILDVEITGIWEDGVSGTLVSQKI